jgi:hypothetical protein
MYLPTRSGYPGDMTLGSIFTEAQAAHAKIAHESPWTTAKHTTVVFSYLELGSSLLLNYE